MKKRKQFIAVAAALLTALTAPAQAPDSLSVAPDTLLPAAPAVPARSLDDLLSEAGALHGDYRFGQAAALYGEALALAEDSLVRQRVEDLLLQSQNGRNMLAYCSQPSVVARQRLSLKDFFLYYPLKDRSWRPVPNQLDSLGGGDLVRAMYQPDDGKELYYSAADAEGIHNLYHTWLRDTVWSAPELINETLTSSSDEIFPMLSPDGNSLYFSSKGLYGMGGYDLYVSRWNRDTHDWETPVNLGFPYSSPADDFLFVNSPDGRYSLFASNRECARDSVWLYVLEYESMPVRKALSDPEEVKALSRLLPDNDPSRAENRGTVMEESVDTRRYTDQVCRVRQLRDSIYAAGHSLDAARARMGGADDVQRRTLAAEILQREEGLTALQDSLSVATARLQQIEMDFLASGVVLDPDKVQREADRKMAGVTSGYAFSRREMGAPLQIDILPAKPTFDYSFMILPEGRFAENNTLPDGLVYQIQLFTTGTPATVKQLKGLSPVFSRTGTPLRYTYSVGVFRSYKDVLDNLNKVKRQGFRSAFIVAFQDGRSITVAQARELEKKAAATWSVRILPADGNSLGDNAVTSIRALTAKDLSKEAVDGRTAYVLGPFDDRTEVDGILSALKAIGLEAELF